MTVDKAALRELLEKATPGPWSTYVRRGAAISVGASHNLTVATIAVPPVGYHVANAHLIAAARESLPALLAENEALRAELQARQWQPIETAPEGVMILCADMKAHEAKDWAFVAWLAGGKLCGHRCGMPTHWMPLPRPPAPPQGETA